MLAAGDILPYHARFSAGPAMFTPFVIGQRYICDAEPELGLGVVTDTGHRTLTIDFPAVSLIRQYAQANAPLSRLRHDSGDMVKDLHNQAFCVLDVREQDGLIEYLARGLSNDRTVTLPESTLSAHISLSQPLKRLLALQIDSPAWFHLRQRALASIGHIEGSHLLGLCSARTDLLPHQLYIAHEVSRRPAPRVLLCDEVGLGKTIEACLILHQQLFSGLAARVLVLVPDSLLHQWLVELLRRFNLRFTILDEERCNAIADSSQVNPFESAQLVLCSRDFLLEQARWQEAALHAGWDLLVMDEAHHLLPSSEVSHAVGLELARQLAAQVPGVLLLTATPDQEGLASHFALLQLLDPNRFHDFAAFVAEQTHYQQLAALLDPLLAFDSLDTIARERFLQQLRGFADDVELHNLLDSLARHSTPVANELVEQLLIALLDRHGTGRIVFRNTRKQVAGFPVRELQVTMLETPGLYREHLAVLYPEMVSLTGSEWLKVDPRVVHVEQLLRNHRDSKFLLICHAQSTASSLEAFLRVQRGFRTAVFHEGMTLLERDRAAAWFAEVESGAQLLVCSEIGSEGRNFQFSQHLILFDLPPNPDLLEQRIGRLDRIGQRNKVSIHVPCLQGSAQAVLLHLYDEIFHIFRQPNPVAAHVCEELAPLLHSALGSPGDMDTREMLLAQAGTLAQRELERNSKGRDRLLELNSCRPGLAETLLMQIREQELSGSPHDFLQDIFAAYGLDCDINSNGTWNVRPGEDMLLEHFPQVPDDGLTFTLQRELALHREDIPFVNWLHPIVEQGLDLVLQQQQGKACVALYRDPRLPAGTLLLEAIFRIAVTAAPALQAKRWFPTTSMRVVIDTQKRSLAGSLPPERINRDSRPLDKLQAGNLVKEHKQTIELLHRLCLQVAERELPVLVARQTITMQAGLDAEINRLSALQAVNPLVSRHEIELVQAQREALTACLAAVSPQVEALRLLVLVK